MKPLLFLTARSFVNNVRRAFTTPRRLLGLIFIIGYYFYFFVRPGLGSRGAPMPTAAAGRLEFPPIQAVDAAMFALFSAMTLVLMLGIFAYRGSFKPADVDVLFATPISPKVVLVFRIVREYLATLILPFFFALIMLKPTLMGWERLFRDMPHPESSGLALKMMSLSWMLMAMCWVAIAYAASMFVNRSDRQSDVNKKVIVWTCLILMTSVVAWVVVQIGHVTGVADLIKIAQSPLLRTVFFTAHAATMMTLAPITHNYLMGFIGLAIMAGIIVVALKLAMTQVGWLYDQAAVRGFEHQEARSLHARGDLFAMAAHRARTGKAKTQKRSWLNRIHARGVWALLWKEYFLQKRGMSGLVLLLVLPALVLGFMPLLMSNGHGADAGPTMFLILQGLGVMMVTLNMAQTGFLEVLRRVDLQKPLPISPTMIAFMEILGKAAWGILAALVTVVASLLLKPLWWPFAVGALLYSPTLSLVVSATVFMTIVLFPDVDEPTQRQFHRLVMFLAVAMAAAPGFGLGAVLLMVGASPPFAGVAAALANLAISLGLTALSGQLYGSYNPSE